MTIPTENKMKILDAHNGKGKCLAPENKIDRQLLTALAIAQAGQEWTMHKFSGSCLVQEAKILFETDLEWSDEGTSTVEAYFQNIPFDPLSSVLGNREVIMFWVNVHDDQTLTVMWDSAGQINFLPYTPSFPSTIQHHSIQQGKTPCKNSKAFLVQSSN